MKRTHKKSDDTENIRAKGRSLSLILHADLSIMEDSMLLLWTLLPLTGCDADAADCEL